MKKFIQSMVVLLAIHPAVAATGENQAGSVSHSPDGLEQLELLSREDQ